MKEQFKKIYNVLDNRFYFKLLYLFVSFTFVTALKCIPGINIFKNIAFAWGILLLVFMFFYDYKKRKLYNFDIALGLFVILTFIFNIFIYRNFANIKIWIVNLILFVVVFSIEVFKNKKQLIKEMNIITCFFAVFMFVVSFISLEMKIFDKNITVGEYFFYGSKGGLFENENAISIAAALTIVMCIYLNYISKNFRVKILWLINIALQFLTMITFKGRSAYLVIIAVVYTFCFIYNKNKYIRSILIILPVLLGLGGYFYEGNQIRDFTSGRTSLWNSAEEVIKYHPISGVGNTDMVSSVINVKPNGDLPGLMTGGLHNIYIQIATVNGIIALILFLIFILLSLIFIVKKIDCLRKKEKMHITIIISMIVGILAVNIFESTLIYGTSFISIIFWIYLGYVISILGNKNL
ncbi:MAG: O-antigen ligase family protein [Clostridium butyricum]|nr:O-antigen ligase family protein [Clostridium butyricum]